VKPALVSEKNHSLFDYPILIVDKKGEIGTEIAKRLQSEGIVVFVSSSQSFIGESLENIIYVPFLKKIPSIPENTYSYIFVIDDKGVLRDSLSSFIKKAEQDKAELIFITSLENLNLKLIEQVKNEYNRSKILIYGDLFDSTSKEFQTTVSEKFIYEARKYGRIDIPGDGTEVFYPVFKQGLIRAVLESVFGTHKNERVFCLYPRSGITYLSFAHLMQRNNPLIKIDFKKKKNDKKTASPVEVEGLYLLETHNLEEGIKQISFEEKDFINESRLIRRDRKKRLTSKKKNRIWPFLLTFFLLALLPLISTLIFAALGTALLQNSKNALVSGNLQFALSEAKIAQKTFKLSLRTIKPLEYEASFIGLKAKVTKLENKIETGKNVADASVTFLNASSAFLGVIQGKSKEPKKDFIQAVNLSKNAIALFQKEINKKSLGEIDKRIDKSLNFISSTIDLWPTLAGFDGKKTYLVILQNNMELRPGGGFIGSYGVLNVENGRILSFEINDVYNADGQLKAHIEPDYPLRRYMLLKHMYLRDSSFALDFRDVSSKVAMLFNLETGIKINGVIGVDLSVVKNILDAVGEIEVTDYKEKVSSENLFYITESHVEKGFFPGSTQKKDFLRSLYQALLVKLNQTKDVSYLSILDQIVKSIDEKHLLFGFSNPGIQNLFTINGWSSSVWDNRLASTNKVNDFLGINEANFGGNKVNYFVSRSVSHRVQIVKDKGISEELTIYYKNDSDGKWPGGDYKNYLRFILPKGTDLKSITIDDQKQKIVDAVTNPTIYEKTSFKPPVGLEVDRNEELGKSIFGFLVTIPKGKLVKIVISYQIPNRLDYKKNLIQYDLKLFKQPGIDSFPYDLTVENPEGYKMFQKTTGISGSNGKEAFQENIVKDRELLLTLSKD
jgi:hypothetical protein